MQNYNNPKSVEQTKAETRKKYADIIDMQRPEPEEVFRRHPRMSTAKRAKIFAPFAALRGHKEVLQKEDEKKFMEERMTLSEEQYDRLSEKIAQVRKGMDITVTHFQPESGSDLGYYTKITGTVTLIDPIGQNIRINQTMIPFSDLLDISGDGIIDTKDVLRYADTYLEQD